MTKIRAEERWRMPSESYSLEKLHPVINKFKYYFMIKHVCLFLRSYHSNSGKKGGEVSDEREKRRHDLTRRSRIPTVIVSSGIARYPTGSSHRSSPPPNP